MSLALAAPVSAADESASAAEAPLAFVEPEAVKASCEGLAAKVGVAIRNETAAKQTVHLMPVEFKDSAKKPVAVDQVCGGLEVKVRKALDGGAGTTATLKAIAKDEGTFSGSLALFAEGGRVARVPVEISPKPPLVTAALNATPLVSGQVAERDDADPISQGPIWIPVNLPNKELPPAPKSDQGTQARTVGALVGPEGEVAVTYSGETKPLTDTSSLVGLDVGDPGPGTYSGTVDLLPEDDEKGTVDIELKVTTWWLFPVLVLLAGIGLGIWVLRMSGRNGPRAKLLGRIGGLQERHDNAVAKLGGGGPSPDDGGGGEGGAKPWSAFKLGDVGALQEELRERVAKSTEKVLVQIDKTVLTDLEGRVSAVEAEIDLLETIPGRAKDLEEALRKLEVERPSMLPDLKGSDRTMAAPSIGGAVEKALTGETVDAADLKTRLDAIAAVEKSVWTMKGLEGRLADLWSARADLSVLEGVEPGTAQLAAIDKALDATRHLLWRAEGSEDLEAAAEELQGAATKVAELWHELPVPKAPPTIVETLGMVASGAVESAIRVMLESLAAEPVAAAAAAATAPATPVPGPQLSEEEAEHQIASAQLSQRIVVLLAAAVALTTGLAALYIDKTWGSTWDYIWALVWGLAAQTTVVSLANSIDVVGALRSTRRAS